MDYSLMVMKSFVSEITEVNMLLNVITSSKWGDYAIHVLGTGCVDSVFQVVNATGKEVNVEWATYDGAVACAELLAEGYLKE
jgi:hypothetical protein